MASAANRNPDLVPDEWSSVAEILCGDREVLSTHTRLGKVLRLAVLEISRSDVSDQTLDVLRDLTDALRRRADSTEAQKP